MSSPKIAVVGIADGWSSRRLAAAVADKTGFRLLVEMDRVTLDLESGALRFEDHNLAELDAIIVKKIGLHYSADLVERLEILRFLENKGIRIFSRPGPMLQAIDRLSNTTTLRAGDIPMPPTTITEDIDKALVALERYQRAVLKPIYSSKARGMVVVEAGTAARTQLKEFKTSGNPLIYMQKMIPLPGHDLGMTFLGGKYLGTYARVGSRQSWNTTTHSGGKYAPYEPSQELIDLADRAQRLFGLDFTSVDVAETPDGPMVFEVSAFGGFHGLLDACGIDAAEAYVDYVVESIEKAYSGSIKS